MAHKIKSFTLDGSESLAQFDERVNEFLKTLDDNDDAIVNMQPTESYTVDDGDRLRFVKRMIMYSYTNYADTCRRLGRTLLSFRSWKRVNVAWDRQYNLAWATGDVEAIYRLEGMKKHATQ